MNIIFDHLGIEKSNQSNVNRETTGYRSLERTGKVRSENYALDISGTVMDNDAYAGHGRTAEDVRKMAGEQDLVNRRNYMAVMSNSVSDEDFARLQKDGFHHGSSEIDTVVTIVDEIKAALLKGGTEVVGYTDTIDQETLKEITGSETFAGELQKNFRENDLPLTKEIAKEVTEAYEQLTEISELAEGTKKYMIENHMTINVDNLYFSKFSGGEDASVQGRGYYMAGNVPGYMAKKPSEFNLNELRTQIEKIIEDAGYSVCEENIQDAGWLIENGMPLTKETYQTLQNFKKIQFPVTEEHFVKSVAAQLSDGVSVRKADLTKTESLLKKAIKMTERQKNLEETRLAMTVSANLKLLKSGFQIETAPMEETIKRLKEAGDQIDQLLMKEEDPSRAVEKGDLFRNTLSVIWNIQQLPVAVISDITPMDTLVSIEKKGDRLAQAYKKANETYEAIGTAPRRDLGDSIRKAFQNVDDILEDLKIEATEDNRKTIRIMGYNQMKMNEKNFEQVHALQKQLSHVIEKCKPAKVLSMIRNGENPLKLSLQSLENLLNESGEDAQNEEGNRELDSYSRFLYKLEKNQEITEEERSAYIGIYRLLHQLEKTDFAAVGAIVETGKSKTLENFLSALRTKKKQIDYQVDQTFGGVIESSKGISISDQIEKGFIRTPEEFEKALSDEKMQEIERMYDAEVYDEVRQCVRSEQEVLRILSDYHQPITVDHMMSAGMLFRNPADPFKKLRKAIEEDQRDQAKELLSKMEDTNLIDCFEDQETAVDVSKAFFEESRNELKEKAFEEMDRFLDVKRVSVLYKQFHFLGNMAKDENYTLPLEIDGEMTAVNLKMIHKDGMNPKVSITMETELFGKMIAEFSEGEEGILGYAVLANREGEELIKEQENTLFKLFSDDGLHLQKMNVVYSNDLNLQEYTLKVQKNRNSGKTNRVLYQTAKAYIRFVSQISRKGIGINEN